LWGDDTQSSIIRNSRNSRGLSITQTTNKKKIVSAAPDAQLLLLLHLRNKKQQLHRSCNTQPLFNIRPSHGVLQSPKLGVETVPMTLNDGRQVYIRRRNTSAEYTSATTTSSSFQSSCSLGVPMRELNRRVVQMKRERLRRQFNASTAEDEGENDYDGNTAVDRMVRSGEQLLWVNKHSPMHFSQLLSDERTNREVLRALRAWDPYVFGRQQPARPKTIDYQPRQQQPRSWGDENKENGGTVRNPNDKRPPENCRVIMLSGPPGVGELRDGDPGTKLYVWKIMTV
jgi:hypothetical protein